MKVGKILSIGVVIVLSMSLMACDISGNKTEDNEKESVGGNVQIANPFVEADSLAEASKTAGYEMSVPDTIEGFDKVSFSAIKGELIEVDYDNDNSSICIRKGLHVDGVDVSGDYNEYTEEKEETVGKVNVTMKGDNGKICVVNWNVDNYDYSIGCLEGLDQEMVEGLIPQIR